MKHTRTVCAIGIVYCGCFLCAVLSAAGEGYLYVEAIEGEATGKNREGWIEMISFSHSSARSVSDGSTSRTASKLDVGELRITKRLDKASPLLLEALARGEATPLVIVDFLRPGSSHPHLQVKLSNVLVSCYDIVVASDGEMPAASVCFHFERLEYFVTTFGDDGSVASTTGVYYNQSTGEGGSIGDNTPPQIGSIADRTIHKNTALLVEFEVSDAETPAGGLELFASSSNPGLIPPENITFGGDGSNRSATVVPVGNAIGRATLTFTVSDGQLSNDTSFSVTVLDPDSTFELHVPESVHATSEWRTAVGRVAIHSEGNDDSEGALLMLSANRGTLTLADDLPGGLTAAQISGNGTSAPTVSAPLDAVRVTFDAPEGAVYMSPVEYEGEDRIDWNLAAGEIEAIASTRVYVHSNSRETWRHRYFASEDITDPDKEDTHWGFLAMPARDGVYNIIKYAFGLNPLEPNRSNLPAFGKTEEDGRPYLTLSMRRRRDDPGVLYVPEIASDTGEWVPVPGEFEIVLVTPLDEEIEHVVYRRIIPMDEEKRLLLRIRVELSGD